MGTPFFVLSGGLAAWGKGLPSASRLRAGHVPPAPPACGPTPCPPWAAAGPPPAPSSPCRSGRGNVAAKAGPLRAPARSSWPPAVARGHPSAMQGQAPAGRAAGPALHCSSPVPVAAQVLRGGPAPTSGGFGAVRPSGPVGGAPASLASPATPAAQAVPRGSAYALAARRSGPGPLAGGAAPPAEPGPRLRAAAAALAPAGGRNLDRRAHWRRKRRLPRASRAAGRRERRLRAGVPAVAPAGKAKASPAQGGKPPTSGGLACQCPGQRWANVAGVPPCAGLPPLLILVNGGAFYVCCCLSCLSCWPGLVAGLPSWWCLWLVAVPVCPVALALCSGGGFCLSAGGFCLSAGGFSSRHLLACWCFCRSAGRRSLRVTAPPWVLSLAGGGPALGAVPCR